jgi:serine/threonine protein kinase
MAKDFPVNPRLRQFLLSDVQQTDTKIGAGAYGNVEEVVVAGAICAAKTIHDFFRDDAQVPPADIKKASTRFVSECQLMSTLRHPNIVQFMGVAVFPDSQLPALIMERMMTSLHDLLAPDPGTGSPPTFFPLSLKCSILHNVACGLTYLHQQTPPVIHRDLSARNVLLNSAMVAKIADLGVARIVPRVRAAATMTKAPGAGIYMPPEALENKPGDENEDVDERGKKSKYDSSIDIFSFGVVAIFTLSQTFPCDLLAPNYRSGTILIGRTELERRERYMRTINRELHKTHPLVRMIEGCLNFPEKRPTICEVLHSLEEAQAEARDEARDHQIFMNRLELVEALMVN